MLIFENNNWNVRNATPNFKHLLGRRVFQLICRGISTENDAAYFFNETKQELFKENLGFFEFGMILNTVTRENISLRDGIVTLFELLTLTDI